MKYSSLNQVQLLALELIKADATFLYALTQLRNRVKSNYITMALPYIGLFADGAEQWGNKSGYLKLQFSDDEKKYYTYLRNSSKYLDLGYKEFYDLLSTEFIASDKHFYDIQSWLERNIIGYKNVGVDFCNNVPCGNTILCGIYTPFSPVKDTFTKSTGQIIKELSIIAGKLCKIYGGVNKDVLKFDASLKFYYKYYNFFQKCPFKNTNDFNTFFIYSILCSINYILYFINDFFHSELTTKLRIAYLQYYYLTDFISDINKQMKTNFELDTTWANRKFRNCMAHYGLGSVMKEEDVIPNVMMGGLVETVFNKSYSQFKEIIYNELAQLKTQLTRYLGL